MTLFTKSLCSACQKIKNDFDLKALGIEVEELGHHNPDALAHLAWHELVETAEKTLPILVLNDSSAISDTEEIRRYLERPMPDGH
jgi:arsenate reductase-like glutaredoxin family protein